MRAKQLRATLVRATRNDIVFMNKRADYLFVIDSLGIENALVREARCGPVAWDARFGTWYGPSCPAWGNS